MTCSMIKSSQQRKKAEHVQFVYSAQQNALRGNGYNGLFEPENVQNDNTGRQKTSKVLMTNAHA